MLFLFKEYIFGIISSLNLQAPIITIGFKVLAIISEDNTGTKVLGDNLFCLIGLSSIYAERRFS